MPGAAVFRLRDFSSSASNKTPLISRSFFFSCKKAIPLFLPLFLESLLFLFLDGCLKRKKKTVLEESFSNWVAVIISFSPILNGGGRRKQARVRGRKVIMKFRSFLSPCSSVAWDEPYASSPPAPSCFLEPFLFSPYKFFSQFTTAAEDEKAYVFPNNAFSCSFLKENKQKNK